jgi:hypothetical protein
VAQRIDDEEEEPEIADGEPARSGRLTTMCVAGGVAVTTARVSRVQHKEIYERKTRGARLRSRNAAGELRERLGQVETGAMRLRRESGGRHASADTRSEGRGLRGLDAGDGQRRRSCGGSDQRGKSSRRIGLTGFSSFRYCNYGQYSTACEDEVGVVLGLRWSPQFGPATRTNTT